MYRSLTQSERESRELSGTRLLQVCLQGMIHHGMLYRLFRLIFLDEITTSLGCDDRRTAISNRYRYHQLRRILSGSVTVRRKRHAWRSFDQPRVGLSSIREEESDHLLDCFCKNTRTPCWRTLLYQAVPYSKRNQLEDLGVGICCNYFQKIRSFRNWWEFLVQAIDCAFD